MIRKCLVLLTSLLLWATVAAANPAAETPAAKFVIGLAHDAVKKITNDQLPNVKREAEFRRMLLNNFDVAAIGRFALGRYWRQLNSEQQHQYMVLFEDMIVKTYANRLGNYKKVDLTVTMVREAGSFIEVTTLIVQPTSTEPARVDWRLAPYQNSFRVVDVVVEGVSLSVTQRSEFSAVLDRAGGQLDALFTLMRERISKGEMAGKASLVITANGNLS